ncbi:site-specific DNA-methyltransferase [Devosia sp. YIM 151766]|uniref:site-specific DNA-methyltransferase n=1 Tax=Devosia sp. YIM 151766 TaxID=3017325 RepID=UPI00255C6F9F|nr:site-specific DNA-methyltransferase [Devosia sp. YIM 151766]WIY52447.1 site-specific DNA-methyltransferase [Devosia sp. YIM 151766]
MKIEMLAVADLVPYARNARTHPEWQIAQIAASIAEFGFANPILCGRDRVIIAGHGRLLAAERLGLETVPVIVLDHLDERQRRALVIADNKIAENAGWDEELLRQELATLREDGFDLDIVGFSETELEEILGGLDDAGEPPALGDPDHVPEVQKRPVSQRGNVWLLGAHRVMCGDSTSKADMATLCGSELVDACWTDPPYNVDYEGSAGKIQNDNMASSDFRRFLVEAFGATASVMKKGGPIYVAHADTEGQNFRAAFKDAGFKLSGCLVWVKPSLVLGRSDYQWRHEPILYGWKVGGPHKWYGGRTRTTVIEDQRPPLRIMPDGTLQIDIGGQVIIVSGEKLAVETLDQSVLRADKPARNAEHPTMKPVGLILEMLENSTKRGDLVLDPFGGSGSTLIACHGAGRSARLMELDEKFADVIVRRWQEYTGLEARLEEDDRTFDVVEAQCKAA